MGECGATLLLADDFADNECTIRCQLEIYFECDQRGEWGA